MVGASVGGVNGLEVRVVGTPHTSPTPRLQPARGEENRPPRENRIRPTTIDVRTSTRRHDMQRST